MASSSTGAKVERPSYSMIAATGLKPPGTQHISNTTQHAQKHDITSSPSDGANFVSPSNGAQSAFTPKQKKLVPLAPKVSKETPVGSTNGPQVHVQSVESAAPLGKQPRALDGMLMPITAEEASTQVSSSSGSGKPPSLDGKSVTSGTTFALDEKESLRPDDSASVKATDDEDGIQSNPCLPVSRAGSDDGVRAFRDQLREISSFESPRPAGSQQDYSRSGVPPQGVLYIPPHGSGIGTVPVCVRHTPPAAIQAIDLPPDPKLLEALDSPKDRIMVLKLEQDIVDFIKDARESSLKLPQTNAFYRMLAHKLADYYMLGHTVDESTLAVQIYKTPNCRLAPPLTGIATPSTAASTPPPIGPQMKILRRGLAIPGPAIVNESNTPSKTTSENGESGNDDDRRHKPTSREEREARYEAARKRIMGSSKPLESPEESVERDDSRSSSAAGKKYNRKKQRAGSDDDFEARSAYSAYYPVSFSPAGPTPPSYGFPNVVDPQSGQFVPSHYGNQSTMGDYQQYGVPRNNAWPISGFQPHESASNWMQDQQAGYDLSGDFQRAMTFQQSPMATHTSSMQTGFNAAYGSPVSVSQQPWPQHSPYVISYPSANAQSYQPAFPDRSPSASSHPQDVHSYPYGQLPSQTFPGRLPSSLEHPLPGSYKSRHFNPQSQAFVPGQVNGPSAVPFSTQGTLLTTSTYGGGYTTPGPLLRQKSIPAQNAAFGSAHQTTSVVPPQRIAGQQMTHPLPQPVFPRNPSPNVPLPPKPEATPPNSYDKGINGFTTVTGGSTGQSSSSIAKWGAPASLPAKPPPPSTEVLDPAKFAQAQRQTSVGSGRASNIMPSFGSMPPPMAGGHGANVQGLQSLRRI